MLQNEVEKNCRKKFRCGRERLDNFMDAGKNDCTQDTPATFCRSSLARETGQTFFQRPKEGRKERSRNIGGKEEGAERVPSRRVSSAFQD
jgi:hypothetical protein